MSGLVNAESLVGKLKSLQTKVMPEALARAVNRVAGTVRTRTTRSVAAATGLKQAPVRRRIVVSRKATKVDPSALIKITGKPLNLIEYKPTPGTPEAWQARRRGVRTSAWGARKLHGEAFVAKMPNGHALVVKRSKAGKSGKKIKRGRWAGKSPHIEAMYGPGIANTASNEALHLEREATVNERLPIELSRELRYRVGKLLAK